VTAIQETRCDESHWHIARLPKTSTKVCFAQQAITKKKCIAKIVQDNKSTIVPKTLFPLNWDNILILGVFTA
jgi:hypothetical protein